MSQPATWQTAACEDLRTMPREQLIELVAGLRAFTRAQAQILTEVVSERDAARLLNEICHY